MRRMVLGVLALAIAGRALTARATVPEEAAARLGEDLNPMGGEIAGNEEGTIPKWTGGLGGVPTSVHDFNPATDLNPNPFSGDKPVFRITAANMDQYADKLTDGYKALLKTYRDTYYMDIYTSRRTCAFPDSVYRANKRDATAGGLIPSGNGVTGAIFGAPFPIIGQGLEMVWNHTLRYRGFKVTRRFAAAPVAASGDYGLDFVQDDGIFSWSDPKMRAAEDLNNISFRYISHILSPAPDAGTGLLMYETVNLDKQPRLAWQYAPGAHRVRRAPEVAYDHPGVIGGDLSTADSFDGYNGAPDRYDWRLVGKLEKYIPYNTYDAALAPFDELLQAFHLNQKFVRYELHRVWQVEARLRPDASHIYARRVMYFDEDANQLATAELYDSRGRLWRVQEIHTLNYYHVPLCGSGAELVYDLKDGRYLATAMRNGQPPANYAADALERDRYTPSTLRSLGDK